MTIQCPTREAASTQRDDSDQVLQAVKFTDKKVPGLHLDLDEEFQAAGSFTKVIRGYQMGVVEPDVMRGLQPAGATRVTLDVHRTDAGKVEADRDAVPAGLAFQLQPTAGSGM